MIVQVKNLNIIDAQTDNTILSNFDFTLKKDKISAIIGESGSGKSTFAFSLIHLLKSNLNLKYDEYTIFDENRNQIHEKQWELWRGKRISLIPQNPVVAYHPYMTIESQILEYFRLKNNSLANRNTILDILNEVGIQNPKDKIKKLPRYLSGGERQRILIAITAALKPEILIADEPTTALDSINEKITLKLLIDLVKKNKIGLLLITHDIRIVKNIADEVTILKKGQIIEKSQLNSNHEFSFNSDYANLLLS